jgi:hypothetical protein
VRLRLASNKQPGQKVQRAFRRQRFVRFGAISTVRSSALQKGAHQRIVRNQAQDADVRNATIRISEMMAPDSSTM